MGSKHDRPHLKWEFARLSSRLRLVAVAAVALLVGAFVGAGEAGLVGPRTSAGRMRPWSVQYMDGPTQVTLGQAVATATDFNAIVALANVYKPYVGDMKAANPSLQLYVYAKGAFTYDGNLPEVAYSHDAYGKRIKSIEFGTYLLNPLAPDALAHQIFRAGDRLRSSGYDGVFLDTLGPAAINPGFVTSLPIDPRTGQVWTAPDWVKATAALAGGVQAALGVPVIGNGLRDGRNYFDNGTNA